MKGNGSNGRNRLIAAAIRCQPDSRLVGLVREGHDVAFEEIVRRHRRPLVSFAATIVPPDHAEDVVQEALAKAHRALASRDAEINLRPWLYTIVRNRALNVLRDEPVHERLDESFDGVPSPPDVAARRQELAALTARMKSLPDQQREAIVMRELEGRSHDEIASTLGVSPGAVRGLIYRARAALRDGAGMLIPMPLLRTLLSPESSPDAAGAVGAAAGLAAGGGGGIALKAGATIGVAVIAVGSGLAIEHGGGSRDERSTLADRGAVESSHSDHALRAAGESGPGSGEADGRSGASGPRDADGRDSSGPSDEPSSGPGPGSRSGSSGDGPGSGTSGSGDAGGDSGSFASGGDDGESSSGSGDDGGGGSGDSDTSGTSDGTSDSGSGGGGSGSSADGGAIQDSSGDGGSSLGSDGGGGDITAMTATASDDGGGTSGPG